MDSVQKTSTFLDDIVSIARNSAMITNKLVDFRRNRKMKKAQLDN